LGRGGQGGDWAGLHPEERGGSGGRPGEESSPGDIQPLEHGDRVPQCCKVEGYRRFT